MSHTTRRRLARFEAAREVAAQEQAAADREAAKRKAATDAAVEAEIQRRVDQQLAAREAVAAAVGQPGH